MSDAFINSDLADNRVASRLFILFLANVVLCFICPWTSELRAGKAELLCSSCQVGKFNVSDTNTNN